MKKLLAWLLLTALLWSAAVSGSAEITPLTKCGTHGTAKRLAGRTAIVSIFASDSRWTWDNWGQDVNTYTSVYHHLGIAARWLMDQAARQGARCELVWDWLDPENYDLYHEHTFQRRMLDGDTAYAGDYDYFIRMIDSLDNDAIMRKHNAENILYMFYFNTKVPYVGWTGYAQPSYGEQRSNVGVYEFVVLPIGYNWSAGTYAHEILHLFGAPDIASANPDWQMSQRFVDDFHRRYPRDIMGGAPSDAHDRVDFVMSPLTAYYVGLTRSSEDQQKWNLRQSEYDRYGY